MEFEIFELSNGIRCIYQARPSNIVHTGLFINAGSRDEPEGKEGLAHFIEHGLFKGTRKRKAFHVISRLEAVGAEINAFTTKELTCIYASSLTQDFARSLELIRDITFDSVFPAREVEKEKDVIIEEIQSYLDNPSEMLFEEFESTIFSGHPLGRNILGTPETVRTFDRKDIFGFIAGHYLTNRMIISVVGGISPARIRKSIERYFGSVEAVTGKVVRKKPPAVKRFCRERKVQTNQVHLLMGTRAYPINHPLRTAMSLLNNILGGPTMNNRLTLNLREKRGLAYHTESNYTAYSDTGMVSIYIGTDSANSEKAIRLVETELKKMREKAIGSRQLSMAKKQLKGQIALAQESGAGVMLGLGTAYLLKGEIMTLDEAFEKIDRVSASDLLEVAREIFNPALISRLIYN